MLWLGDEGYSTFPKFEISVRELIGSDGEFHRVGFERSQAWRRLSLGQEAHRRTLAARQERFPGYRGEVQVRGTFESEDFHATVTGRIDGAVEGQPGHWLIEEYKTCPFTPEGRPIFPPDREERARRQLLVYCVLWASLGTPFPAARLVLVDPAAAQEQVHEVSFSPHEARAEVLRWLREKFRIWKDEERRRQSLAALADNIPFPFESPRPIQEKLMEAIHHSILQGGHLMAQAPTGSGKTAAALHAGLSEAFRKGKKLLFLTAKTLQQTLALETLAAMNRGGFHVLLMRAKEKMCANTRVICHEEHCPFAKDYPVKMARSGLLNRLLANYPLLLPDTIFGEARNSVVCPFEVEVELGSRAEVFVGDYNYLIEPAASLSPFAPEYLHNFILVVDEAHNLPERARQIYSPQLLEKEIAAVQNLASLSPGEVWRRIGAALECLREYLTRAAQELPEAPGSIAETVIRLDDFDQFLLKWDSAIVAYFEWKRETGEASEDDPVLALHFAIVRFGLVLRRAEGKDDFARVIERAESGLRLALICLDPSRVLAPILNAASSTILLSATLAPFPMLTRLTGLAPERTASIDLPPPFPRENREVLIIPSVSTTFKARGKNFGKIARLIAGMADAHRGNDLAIFPSYRFLREVESQLPHLHTRVLSQRENLSDFEKREILAALERPPEHGLLFLAVSGGMFSEGVDYPGEKLSGVFVVSPSLPQVSFERELLRRYFDDHEEPGFEYAYILPGMTRVIQAAGRLIRSETDRGVIALLCRRFLEEPYVRFLPRDWYDESPKDLSCRDPEGKVREFFEKSGRLAHDPDQTPDAA